jgi:phage gp46-like protein
MPQDVLIKPDPETGIYDLVVEGSDFASAEGFETAIATSYFTDARADAVQVQEAQNRRGWVGNILYLDNGREIGGLLWVLDQARITEDTLNFAKSFAMDCLQWMTDDNVARSVEVIVEQTDPRSIKIFTNITTVDNTVLRYVTLWRDTDLSRAIS